MISALRSWSYSLRVISREEDVAASARRGWRFAPSIRCCDSKTRNGGRKSVRGRYSRYVVGSEARRVGHRSISGIVPTLNSQE